MKFNYGTLMWNLPEMAIAGTLQIVFPPAADQA
jgi:hypothetical protein